MKMYSKTFSIFCWPVLALLLLVFTPLSGTEAGFPVTNELSCGQSKQRTISLGVSDKAGTRVDTLRLEDLSLAENKTPGEIIKLERGTNDPLSVAVLIDTSASQEHTLGGTKLAAQKFAEAILRSDKDRIAVVSFTGEAIIEQDLTNDLARLQAAINRIKFVPPPNYLTGGVVLGPLPSGKSKPVGSTAIWDAIWATVDDVQPTAGSRRLIVLLTDGEDTSSTTKMRTALEHAASQDVAIFCIGIADERNVDLDRDRLKKLAEETGGLAFFPKKVGELDGIFSQILLALQSHYRLTYCSPNSKPAGQPVRLQIEVKNASAQPNLRLSYPHYGL